VPFRHQAKVLHRRRFQLEGLNLRVRVTVNLRFYLGPRCVDTGLLAHRNSEELWSWALDLLLALGLTATSEGSILEGVAFWISFSLSDTDVWKRCISKN
jgi:hypothetical protein